MPSPSPLPPAGHTAYRTLGAALRRQAAERPDDLAFVFVPRSAHVEAWSLTYGQLDRRARAVAAHLGSVTAPGTRVLLAFPAGADLAGALFGCLLAGMVAVPMAMSEGTGVDEVATAVRDCSARVVLTDADRPYGWRDLGELEDVAVMEADALTVGGTPASWLAERWMPVGVMAAAAAYVRYRQGEPDHVAFTQRDVLGILALMSRTARLGLDDGRLAWLADVHGLELSWQVLLPVFEGSTAWVEVQ